VNPLGDEAVAMLPEWWSKGPCVNPCSAEAAAEAAAEEEAEQK
jgi:hypothetical protein